MKKLLSIMLTAAMLVCLLPVFAVSADAVQGSWTKDSDTAYSVSNHQDGNAYFDYYELGKDSEYTVSADLVASGRQQGFLLGTQDCNGDGKIKEGEDNYYLVILHDGNRVGIERNDRGWRGWYPDADPVVANGETVTLKATYKLGYINVFVNGTLVLEYGDPNTWDNGDCGFGLASKVENDTISFTNVSVDTETPVAYTLGAGSVDVATAENNAMWTVEGNKYTLNITKPEDGYGNARFASYVLGNSDKKVTVTGKYTFNEFSKWGNDNGGDNGFLFAIADKNGDGKVTEGGDYYYLVDVRSDGSVGIEKNQSGWGGWCKESGALNLEVGKEYTVSASYDPATGNIVVTIDGTEVINWTDPNPMLGTGYALASKTPNFVMSDVAVVDEAVKDEPTPTPTPVPTGDVTAVASALAILAVIGTAVVVTKKREF